MMRSALKMLESNPPVRPQRANVPDGAWTAWIWTVSGRSGGTSAINLGANRVTGVIAQYGMERLGTGVPWYQMSIVSCSRRRKRRGRRGTIDFELFIYPDRAFACLFPFRSGSRLRTRLLFLVSAVTPHPSQIQVRKPTVRTEESRSLID